MYSMSCFYSKAALTHAFSVSEFTAFACKADRTCWCLLGGQLLWH